MCAKYNDVVKIERRRTLGSYQLYIYKSGEQYVLQMEYKSKDDPAMHWGKYVASDRDLAAMIGIYNNCIADYNAKMKSKREE